MDVVDSKKTLHWALPLRQVLGQTHCDSSWPPSFPQFTTGFENPLSVNIAVSQKPLSGLVYL